MCDQSTILDIINHGRLDVLQKEIQVPVLEKINIDGPMMIKNKIFSSISILHYCVVKKQYPIMIYLLDNSFNPNLVSSGWTPLQLAVHLEDMDSIDLLIFYGADPFFMQDGNSNSVFMAITQNKPKILSSLLRCSFAGLINVSDYSAYLSKRPECLKIWQEYRMPYTENASKEELPISSNSLEKNLPQDNITCHLDVLDGNPMALETILSTIPKGIVTDSQPSECLIQFL